MTLYLKHRPQTFDDIVGNKETVSSLESMLQRDDRPHAFLFYGPSGTGKTTLGRIVANELGCSKTDFKEVDSADFRGIDTIRGIRSQSVYKPLEGPCRVWLLDEVHQLSKDGQNALLKALEDTPKHVYYILCTTDPQKLIDTIKGRCSQFETSLLSETEMTKLIHRVTKVEGESLEKEVRKQIVQDSLGHARNALQILDQVLSVEPDQRVVVAKKSAEQQSQTIELCRALLNGEPWKKVSNILSGLSKSDFENIRRAVLGYCSSVLLKGDNPQAAAVMEEFVDPFYNSGFPGLVLACYSVIFGESEE